jgi:hypothetical protein
MITVSLVKCEHRTAIHQSIELALVDSLLQQEVHLHVDAYSTEQDGLSTVHVNLVNLSPQYGASNMRAKATTSLIIRDSRINTSLIGPLRLDQVCGDNQDLSHRLSGAISAIQIWSDTLHKSCTLAEYINTVLGVS